MRETRQLREQLVSLLLSHKGKNELIGQFAVGREREKKKRGVGREISGSRRESGEGFEACKIENVGKEMMGRGDRGGGDAQHVDDRKSYSSAERTRGADRDLNKQQFIPLVFWYIA